jgi:integrase
LLKAMAKQKRGDYLFPGEERGDTGGERPRVTIRRPWVQVCKAAGLTEEIRVKGKHIDPKTGQPRELVRFRPTLRIHDLRHSFASTLASAGVSLFVIGKLLGHTQPGTTARYAHLADSPLREAANKMGKIVSGGKR